MDDFRNNYTPAPHGDDDMQPQQPSAEQNAQSQQPAQEQAAPQYEEPRTPYQTPVQHPE